MENRSVENILSSLIEGKNPETGIQLNSDSPFLEEHIKEALSSALDAVKNYQAHLLRRRNFPAKTGKPWTKEDDQKLSIDFDLGLSVEQLAKSFQRTRGSINARLIKLGKLEDLG